MNIQFVGLRRALLLQVILIVFSGTVVRAEQVSVGNMAVSTNEENLVLSFNLENAFTEKIVEALESGVKISFSLPVKVYKRRNFWPDKKVVSMNLIHAIKYDAMKKEYLVTRSWIPDKPVTVTDFEEAAAIMNSVAGLELAKLAKLEKGELYRAMAKAKLDRLSLPYYLKYFLFFISFWEFETDWGKINFQY